MKRFLSAVLVAGLLLFAGSPALAASKMYWAPALSGTTGLSAISGAQLAAGDSALVIIDVAGTPTAYLYRLYEDSAVESSPDVISPTSNATTKRWHLVKKWASINALSIGAGSVSDTEFGYLDGVTSAIQTQFTGKSDTGHAHSGTYDPAGTAAGLISDSAYPSGWDTDATHAPSKKAVHGAISGLGIGNVTSTSTTQTWGSGTGNVVHTYSVTGTDPVVTFSNDYVSIATSTMYLPGKLGIGTTQVSPFPNHSLDVRGTAGFYGSGIDGTLADVIFFGSDSYPTLYRNKLQSSISASAVNSKLLFSLSTGGSTFADVLMLKGDGKVGIGTTAPDVPLEINAATGGALRLTYNDADGSAANHGDISVGATGTTTIAATGTNPDIVLTPNGTGQVKIGSSKMPNAAGTPGNVLKSDGTDWTSAAPGYQPSDQDLTDIAALTCTENQIIKRNGAGAWVCGADDGGLGDVTSVGDCTGGACFDGSSDGGTYIRLYDGTGAYISVTGTVRVLTFLPSNANAESLVVTFGDNNNIVTLSSGTGGVVNITGNAATATALAADPANCAAGQIAVGITAAGVAECVSSLAGSFTFGQAAGAGAGYIKFLEDPDHGTNTATLIGPHSTADVTITLPAATGTVALTADKLSAFAATTSAELAGVISDETGTGVLVLADSPTFVDDITIGAAGVKLTGANGSLTILGLGDGADEDVKIDLNTTANTIIVSSPASSAATVSFSALDIVTTGTISGRMPTVVYSADGTLNVSVAQAQAGTFFVNTYAGTLVMNLPAAAAGMAVCLKNGQGNARILQVDTDGTDYVVMSTGARTSAAGDIYAATASATNQICLVAFDATDWYVTSERGTWAEE